MTFRCGGFINHCNIQVRETVKHLLIEGEIRENLFLTIYDQQILYMKGIFLDNLNLLHPVSPDSFPLESLRTFQIVCCPKQETAFERKKARIQWK